MKRSSYAASLVIQGKHKFYSLAAPSDVLAQTCYISDRYEDPVEGFQRRLDKDRAQQIADYIDNEQGGTIPTAIILSAQPNSNFAYDSKKKTIAFDLHPKAFLILDGQHRVYGFSLAKTAVRVPVIIYNGLSRRDETRLFIDINTKQKPVPNELLLDIKALAEYENTNEQFLRTIFDKFKDESGSALLGKLVASERVKSKISRVTFNSALKPIAIVFGEKEPTEVYNILNNYLKSIEVGFKIKKIDDRLTNPIIFKALISIFPEIAAKVKDKYGEYTVNNFSSTLTYFFESISTVKIRKSGLTIREVTDHFLECLKKDFTL